MERGEGAESAVGGVQGAPHMPHSCTSATSFMNVQCRHSQFGPGPSSSSPPPPASSHSRSPASAASASLAASLAALSGLYLGGSSRSAPRAAAAVGDSTTACSAEKAATSFGFFVSGARFGLGGGAAVDAFALPLPLLLARPGAGAHPPSFLLLFATGGAGCCEGCGACAAAGGRAWGTNIGAEA